MKKTLKKLVRKALMRNAFLVMLLTIAFYATAQKADTPITGSVTNQKNEPLVGVSILIQKTTKGTTTDASGMFKLRIAEGTETVLEVSLVGYQKQLIKVGKQTTFQIQLLTATGALDEVVVVGYGTQKKINITGSVTTVSAKKIENLPVANISSAIVGRLPGLIAINRGGQPGEDAPIISIRGFENMLVIVDGVENDFNNIDPKEIDNISILKDASAAIYGARAGNGVLLVTTKRGKSGAPTISFSSFYGNQAPTRIAKQVDAPTYARMVNEAEIEGGGQAKYTADEIEKFRNGTDPKYPNTNWYNQTFNKTAPIAQFNVNTSGGSEKINYFFSVGYLKQDGLLKTSDLGFKRFNLRSNIDVKINNSLSVSLDLSGRVEQRDQPGGSVDQILGDLTFSQPIFAAHFPDPTKLAYSGHLSTQPLGRSNKDFSGYSNDNRRIFNASLTFKYDFAFVKGLSAKALFNSSMYYGYTKNFSKEFHIYNYDPVSGSYSDAGLGQNSKTQLNESFGRATDLTSQVSLNYIKKVGLHDIQALVLGEFIQNRSNNFKAHREGFLSTSIDQLFAGSAANQDNGGTAGQDGRIGYAGRLNYAYNSKYLVEATLRYDGSARYISSKRWSYFPGVSVGWRLSKEKFLTNITAIDNLKLRASYGKAGNDYVGQFNYLTGYNFGGNNVFGDPGVINTGIVTRGLANPDLSWEKTTTNNIGLDGSLWKGLLSFELDWFYRKVTDVAGYRNRSLPTTVGATLPQENINSYDNRGFEIVLRHENTVNKVRYSLEGNLTYSRAKWIHYDEPTYADAVTKNRLQLSGQWKNRFFGYEAAGLFQSQDEINKWPVVQDGNGNSTLKPGDIKYKDYNGDGVLDYKDQHVIGKGSTPDIFFGFNIGAQYKGFDISVLLQGAANFNAYFSGLVTDPFTNGNVPFKYLTDYWTPQNTGAKYPRLVYGGAYNNKFTSTFWLQDAKYLRVKNVQLGYTIPKSVLSKMKISAVRIYVAAYNILTFDKVSPYDPETGFSTGLFYPQQKSYNAGINITF